MSTPASKAPAAGGFGPIAVAVGPPGPAELVAAVPGTPGVRPVDLVYGDPPFLAGNERAWPVRSRFEMTQTLERRAALAVRRLLGDHVIVLDIEPQGQRIIEIGLVRLSYGYIEAVESMVVDPGLEVLGPAAGGAAKQAKAALVADAGSFVDQMAHFHNFVAGHRLFAGWSVGNDRVNLANELQLARSSAGETTWIDGMDLYRLARCTPAKHKVQMATAWKQIFGEPWAQTHVALDDALHTAHLLRTLCWHLDLTGVQAEAVPTAKGWLGTDWQPLPVIGQPKRRYSLPPQPSLSSGGQNALGQRVERWRSRNDLPPRAHSPGPQDRADRLLWRQGREQQWRDSQLTVRYAMPVPVSLHEFAAKVDV